MKYYAELRWYNLRLILKDTKNYMFLINILDYKR